MLETELRNPKTTHIDKMTTAQMLSAIQEENLVAVNAVGDALPSIEKAVDAMAEVLKKGGRLIYMGAGTSGRTGIIDATECPPTFGVDPKTVVGITAGGNNSVFRSSENAEDKGEGAVQAILAGCDIVLYYPSNCRAITEAVEAVYEAVESGRISQARIEESFRRVQKQKEKYAIADCEADLALAKKLTGNEADIREAFADKLRSITCLKNDGVLDTLKGKKLLCIAPVCDAMRGVDESRRQILSFAEELCKEFEDAVHCVSSLDGVTEPVRDAIDSDYDMAILGVFNADIKPGQLAILDALQEKGKPVVAVLLNSPYDRRFVESCNAIVTGYEYTILSVKALIRAIGDNHYPGTLPVRI